MPKNSKRKRNNNFKPYQKAAINQIAQGGEINMSPNTGKTIRLPQIVAAAAAQYHRSGDWLIISMPKPMRHMSIREELKRIGQNDFQIEKQWEMGFLTNEGKFLNRRQALGLVENNGQIVIGKNDSPSGLISDDLW